jgi:arsenate reductase-like glutaredoxin family protein
MAKVKLATIYHNPKCSTSRQVLEMIEAAGVKAEVIEYLKTAGLTPRLALRTKAKEAEELGLLDAKISDAKLLDAMIAHPVLVERPFVTTTKGTKLCRPKESVRELL